ncbi:hypothetical protein AAC387_Pa02g4680 [Persea americana]
MGVRVRSSPLDCISFFLLEFLPFLFVDSAISQTSIRRTSLGFSCRLYDSSSDVSIERLTGLYSVPFGLLGLEIEIGFVPSVLWFC